MSSAIITQLIPLFLLIAVGYVAGRWLRVRGEDIAPLLIYLITPAVVFSALLRIQLSWSTIALPVLMCFLCWSISLMSYWGSSRIIRRPTSNLLAFAAGNANSGYFAIPVGVALYGEQALPLIVLAGFGFLLFENTLGVYMMALGRYSPRDALAKLLRLPTVYAFLGGVAANAAGLQVPEQGKEFLLMVRHTYSVLGMMLLGLGLSSLKSVQFDRVFLAVVIVAKHLIWPMAAWLVLTIEANLLGVLSFNERQIFLYMSVLPLAANTVAWATLLNVEPAKASLAVLVSTLLAPIGIVMLTWWAPSFFGSP